MDMRRAPRGFTLIELLVVVLIVGILMTLGIPQYTKTIESSKADAAAATVKMIGQANRMYKLDRGAYATGAFSDLCNSKSCDSSTDACQLVACKYLASQKWSLLDYAYYAKDTRCPIISGEVVACAKRDISARSPYNSWAYTMDGNSEMKGHSAETNQMPPAPPN